MSLELPNQEHICSSCGTIEKFLPVVHYWNHIEGLYYCPNCDRKFMERYYHIKEE